MNGIDAGWARWGWLVGDAEFGLEAGDFAELMAHVEALTFPVGRSGYGGWCSHWHWDPLQFVANWRCCLWLGALDFERALGSAPRLAGCGPSHCASPGTSHEKVPRCGQRYYASRTVWGRSGTKLAGGCTAKSSGICDISEHVASQ